MQRPARASGGDLRLGLRGLPPREVERARDERVRLAVELLDAMDQRFDQLDRGELAGGDEARQLGYRQVVQGFRHGA